MFKSKKKPMGITSIIGEDVVVKGDIEFSNGVQINGVVEGNVSVKGPSDSRAQLTLNRSGRVTGNVSAPFLNLNGEVEGNVNCQKFLLLEKNCRIVGDVQYLSMNMEPGAVISGRVHHAPEGLMIEHKNDLKAPVKTVNSKSSIS